MSTEELSPRESMEFDGRRGGEGVGSRRAYLVRGGDRSGVARQTDSGLARGRRLSAEDRGQGRQVLLDDHGHGDTAAGDRDAAADEQSPLLYRLARRYVPLGGAARAGAGGRGFNP